MASQPLYQPYCPTSLIPADRPNISVAFSNGAAAVAVGRVLAAMPASMRSASLEEINTFGVAEQAASDTRALIAAARTACSPAVYEKFLDWGEAAARFAGERIEDDDLSDRLYAPYIAALDAVAETPALTLDDLALKTWIAALEASDSRIIGPLEIDPADRTLVKSTIFGLIPDLHAASCVVRDLDDIARRVKPELKTASWPAAISHAVADAFASGAAQLSMEKEVKLPGSDDWSEALTDFATARDRSMACPVDHPEVDALCDAYCVAMDHLIEAVPAPDLQAVVVKIDLARSRADALDEVLFRDHARAIIADIRRLAVSPPPGGTIMDRGHASRLIGAAAFNGAFRERNHLVARIDSPRPGRSEVEAEREDDVLCDRSNRLELQILQGEAGCPGDAIIKLVALAQVSAEGSEPPMAVVRGTIRDAQRHLGIGYLCEATISPAERAA